MRVLLDTHVSAVGASLSRANWTRRRAPRSKAATPRVLVQRRQHMGDRHQGRTGSQRFCVRSCRDGRSPPSIPGLSNWRSARMRLLLSAGCPCCTAIPSTAFSSRKRLASRQTSTRPDRQLLPYSDLVRTPSERRSRSVCAPHPQSLAQGIRPWRSRPPAGRAGGIRRIVASDNGNGRRQCRTTRKIDLGETVAELRRELDARTSERDEALEQQPRRARS